MPSKMESFVTKVNDPVIIGGVKCDYLKKEDWRTIAANWLEEDSFHHVVTLNPEMIMLAQTDREFKESLAAADLRVPDGAGIIWARWYLRSEYWSLLPSLTAFAWQVVERITGVDMVVDLAGMCAAKNRPIFLLGGRREAAAETKQKLIARYPALEVIEYADVEYDISGPAKVIEEIDKQQPAVLLVAFGAPKQTLWLENNRDRLKGVKIGVGVGGAFEILSEKLPRAPKILRNYNMEWLWRLYLEPKRLPRIWNAVVKYPNLIRRQKVV